MHGRSLEIGYTFPAETALRVSGVKQASDIWMQMLRSADESIDIEQLYIASRDGSCLDPIIEQIHLRAQQGVRVRVLIDEDLFKKNLRQRECDYIRPVRALQNIQGLRLRFSPAGRLMGGVQHAKFFVVDNQLAWIGSQNFDWRSLEHIVEVGVRIDNKQLVSDLAAIFEMDWIMSVSRTDLAMPKTRTRENRWQHVWYRRKEHLARIVASPETCLPGPGFYDLPHIVESIRTARETVAIQLRKYTTIPRCGGFAWPTLDSALRAAARRGVLVRVMLDERVRDNPQHRDILADLSTNKNCEIRLLSVPDSINGPIPFARMLHAKTLTVDSRTSWIGTSNGSPDDFLRSRNVGLMVSGEAFAYDVQRILDTSWNSGYSKLF